MKKKTLGKILVVTCFALGFILVHVITAYCEDARISGGIPDTGYRRMDAVNRIKQGSYGISVIRPDGTVIFGRAAAEAEFNRLVALGSTATPEQSQLREQIGRLMKSWRTENSTPAEGDQLVLSPKVKGFVVNQLGSYKKETQPPVLSFTRMGLDVTVQLGPKKDGNDTLKITIGNQTFEGTKYELKQLFKYADDGLHHVADPTIEQSILQGLLGEWDDLVNKLGSSKLVKEDRYELSRQ